MNPIAAERIIDQTDHLDDWFGSFDPIDSLLASDPLASVVVAIGACEMEFIEEASDRLAKILEEKLPHIAAAANVKLEELLEAVEKNPEDLHLITIMALGHTPVH